MPDIDDSEIRSSVPWGAKEVGNAAAYLAGCRRVLLTGQLSEKTVKKAATDMLRMDYESDRPIEIVLESGGGDYDATAYFYEVIAMLNAPVDVIAMGQCCSMAVDLVQRCRKRMLLPSTRVLVHYIRTRQPWICDDPERVEVDIQYFRQRLVEIREERFALYEKRTGLPRQKLEELFRHGETHGAHFSAKQAVEFGLFDEILTDFKFFPGRHKKSSESTESPA